MEVSKGSGLPFGSLSSTTGVGKNKSLRQQEGNLEESVDLFSKKYWYGVKVLAMFNIRNIDKTLVMKTQGMESYLMVSRVMCLK